MGLKISKPNVADWISISRIVLVPVLLLLVFFDKRLPVGWVLLAGFLTDTLDGFIARKFEIASKRGAKLDSMADLLFLVSGLFSYCWAFTDFVLSNLWIFIAAVALFLVQFTASRIRYKQASSFHTYLAKITAIALAALLVSSFLYEPMRWLHYLAFSIAILEAIEEIVLVLMLPEPKNNVKGIFWVIKEK